MSRQQLRRSRRDDEATQEGLGDFLVWDFVEQARTAGRPAMEDTLRANFAADARSQRGYRQFAPADRLYNLLRAKLGRGGGEKVLFQSVRFDPILQEVRHHYETGIVAFGLASRLYAARRRMGYVAIDDLPPLVFRYLQNGDEHHLRDLQSRMKAKLARADPDYVVLWNDSLPLERGLILASRDLGITTITVQDGIYADRRFMHGHAADHVFVWGPHFRQMYLKSRKRTADQVHVLGYPYPLEVDAGGGRREMPAVMYLGQNLENYRQDLLPPKLETIQVVHHISRALGFRFLYRPHPHDDREMLGEHLPGVAMTSPRESLEESIRRADIFVSFNSTALIEAAMHRRMAIQLRNFPLQTDNFEELGIVNRSLRTLEQLEAYLAQLPRQRGPLDFGFTFNQDYIQTPASPGARFVELLEALEPAA